VQQFRTTQVSRVVFSCDRVLVVVNKSVRFYPNKYSRSVCNNSALTKSTWTTIPVVCRYPISQTKLTLKRSVKACVFLRLRNNPESWQNYEYLRSHKPARVVSLHNFYSTYFAPQVCAETSACLHVKCPISFPHLYAVLPTFSDFMATALSIYPLVELRPFYRRERTLAVHLVFVRNKFRDTAHSQTAILSFKPPVSNLVTINQRFSSCDGHH